MRTTAKYFFSRPIVWTKVPTAFSMALVSSITPNIIPPENTTNITSMAALNPKGMALNICKKPIGVLGIIL